MKRRTKSAIVFSFMIIFIVSLIIILHFFTPEEIVNKIGVHNAYILLFLVSFLAGFSAVTSFPMVATIITLVAGGLNPFYIGFIAGISLILGDFIMFFTFSKGREIIIGGWDKKLKKIAKYFEGKKRKFIPFVVYIYIGLTPFPNDLLLVFLAMIKYPLKKLYIPLILGDITYPLLIAILTSKGIMVFG